MNIGVLNTIMCANMIVQNAIRIQEKNKEESQKVQPTFESTFNKEKQKGSDK